MADNEETPKSDIGISDDTAIQLAASTDADWSWLPELADSVQTSETLYSPDKFGGIDPESEGSWRYIKARGKILAYLWTDWDQGAGIISMFPSAFSEDIHQYFLAAKSAGLGAGSAYTSVPSYIETKSPKGVSLSASETGQLSDLLTDILGGPDEDDTDDTE